MNQSLRCIFRLLSAWVLALGLSSSLQMAIAAPAPEAIRWVDIRKLGIEGQGWGDTKDPFDRLPARAEGVVTKSVWNLSSHSAGMLVRFITDATNIHARWVLTSPSLAMPHMPATGVSGLDLYVKADDGRWRWLAVGMPNAQTNQVRLVGELPPGRREYLLYLPLYNGVRNIQIGTDENASILAAGPWSSGDAKPMVFYGTSIVHGACASRPGMCHPAILGRQLQRSHINLGFSGSGRMEPAMADLLAELDASVYVLDCLPNLEPAEVTARVEPFVKKLRSARPKTPILLVEDRTYADSYLNTGKRLRNEGNRAALKKAYDQLRRSGIRNLHYLKGSTLLGDDYEGTVDSSHPSDLGFVRQADAHARVLRSILKK